MRTLDTSAFQRARDVIARARPLERALFAHAFEDAPTWPVLDALATFRNPDGGFGHGLEPDHLSARSSALATSVALRRLVAVDASPEHALVRDAVAWCRSTLVPHERVWPIVPDQVDGAHHAPWWDTDGLERRFNGFTLNPKADLLAQLYALGAGDDGGLDRLADDVVREAEHRSAAGIEIDMHELSACVALVDAPHVPVPVRHRLFELLTPHIETTIGRDADAWRHYGLRPLAIAPRPGSAYAGTFGDLVEAELDVLIETQHGDGAWRPTWSWGRSDDVWERQREVWAGVLTLEALVQLRAYGRLES
jgi:hypothetical protein